MAIFGGYHEKVSYVSFDPYRIVRQQHHVK